MPTTIYHSPIGPLRLIASDAGLSALGFCIDKEQIETTHHPILEQCCSELERYFTGQLQTFKVPLDIKGTLFQMSAWAALTSIPYGQTISYQHQAEQVGRAQAYRAVANANAANRLPIIIPCHRVVRASGALGGYAGGIQHKAWLLAHERSRQVC